MLVLACGQFEKWIHEQCNGLRSGYDVHHAQKLRRNLRNVCERGDLRDNPKYLRMSASKLKYRQSSYSKYKGKESKKKLATLHEKVANQRNAFLHKESYELVRENHTIAMEDLNVKGMLKNPCLAKSVADASWSTFTTMVAYTCAWYGGNLLKIGRFEPSSKTCSHCGTVNQDLTLSDRAWTCTTTHDRDLNTAVNIKNVALKNQVSGIWDGY